MWTGPMTEEMEDIYLWDESGASWLHQPEDGAGDGPNKHNTNSFQDFMKDILSEESTEQSLTAVNTLDSPVVDVLEIEKPFDLEIQEPDVNREFRNRRRVRRSLFKLSEIKPNDPLKQESAPKHQVTSQLFTKFVLPSSPGTTKRVRFFQRSPVRKERRKYGKGNLPGHVAPPRTRSNVKQYHMPRSKDDIVYPQMEARAGAMQSCFQPKFIPKIGGHLSHKNIVPLKLGACTSYYLPGKSVPEPHLIQIYKNPEGLDCLLVPVPSGGPDNFVLQPISTIPFMHSGMEAETPEDDEYVLTWIPFRD